MPGDPNGVTKYMQRLKALHGVRGKAFYVNNSTVLPVGGVAGADNASVGESELQPFATIDYAIGRCTASRGDAIFVDAFHSETVTASITMDIIGVRIIGLKSGNRMPIVTVNGAIDALTITAASCQVSGLHMTIVTTDAATALINVAAAYAHISGVRMIPSATSVNVVDCITLAAGADDCLIENVRIINTVVAVNSFVNIEAAIARLQIRGCRFYGDCATAGLIDAAVVATFVELENNVIATIGSTIPAAILDGNAAPLIAIGNSFLGTSTTIADNAQLGNLARRTLNMVLEATDGTVSATPIIPAYDTE